MDQTKLHGILNLNKPAGISSSDILGPFRRLGRKRFKVGHAGTLDPFATGVLIVLLGDGTRLQSLAMNLPKTYQLKILFGRSTDTLDPDGIETTLKDAGSYPPENLDDEIRSFIGTIKQEPPAYSALKIDGQRAYDLARDGQAVDMSTKTRHVTIYNVRVDDNSWPIVTLSVHCSAGTYMRSLARDLGHRFGLPAMLIDLERTAIGPWSVANAASGTDFMAARQNPQTISDLCQTHVESLSSLVVAADVPSFDVTLESARRFAAGISLTALNGKEGQAAITTEGGNRLVGIGSLTPTGLMPKTILSSSRSFLENQC